MTEPQALIGKFLAENVMQGVRADLAACLLAQVDDNRHVRHTVSVVTTFANPTMLQWIRREALATA